MSRTNTKNSIERAFVAALQATLGSNAAFLNKCAFFEGQNTGELTLPAVVVACSSAQNQLMTDSEVYKGQVQVDIFGNAHDVGVESEHDTRALQVSQLLQQVEDVVEEINSGDECHVYGYIVTDESRVKSEVDLVDRITIDVDFQPITKPEITEVDFDVGELPAGLVFGPSFIFSNQTSTYVTDQSISGWRTAGNGTITVTKSIRLFWKKYAPVFGVVFCTSNGNTIIDYIDQRDSGFIDLQPGTYLLARLAIFPGTLGSSGYNCFPHFDSYAFLG